MLSNELENCSIRFKKSLKSQSELIKKVEERRQQFGTGRVQTNKNPFLNANFNDEDETEQELVQLSKPVNTEYYQERLNFVTHIEKAMGEIKGIYDTFSVKLMESRSIIEPFCVNQNTQQYRGGA